MKNILITGGGSYIGTSFAEYLSKWPEKYHVDTVDMIDGSWRNKSFSGYDVVYHVDGIAHSDSGKISAEKEKLYRSVNTDLAVETANKAKREGVKQFIFMSSAIIYGDSAPIGKSKLITRDTKPSPTNCYGDSKLQAEKGILPLSSEFFKVVVLRPPMIYGKGCKGNFAVLEKMVTRLSIFPKVKNQRSMLYIGNFVEFVKLMVDNNESGIFWPQNSEYSNTSELVVLIAQAKGKKIWLIPGCTCLLKIASHFTGFVNKAFGNLTYDKAIGDYQENYNRYNLEKSISIVVH